LDRLRKAEKLVICKYGSAKVYCEPDIMAYLLAHGLGTDDRDRPIVPLATVTDAHGMAVGRLVTERVGKNFVRKEILD